MFKIRAYGVETTQLRLRDAGERVKDTSRKTMHRGADHIIKEAKINTPVDTHNLESSIKKEVEYGYRGRLQISIVVGGTVDGVNVDTYAMEVHERYEDMGGPGKGTMEKRLKYPDHYIGEKFLERPFEEQRHKLFKAIQLAVAKAWF